MASRGFSGPALRVLLVEDNELDARLIRAFARAVSPRRYDFLRARSLGEALRRLRTQSVDVVLLDLELPDACGLDAVDTLVPFADSTPIVVVSGNDDDEALEGAFAAGVEEFLLKGRFDAAGLDRAIWHAIQRHGRVRRLERDVRHAEFEAAHDSLTGLPNRHCFVEQLEESISYARRYGRRLGLLFVDVDHFKWINDRMGHAAGDVALGEIAQRLRGALRQSDVAARLGGDEFAILIKDIGRPEDAAVVARNVLKALRRPWQFDDCPQAISGSIGVALFPEDAKTYDRLLRAADTAMYVAKAEGRDQYQFFQNAAGDGRPLPTELDREIAGAIDTGQVELQFQQTIDTRSGEPVAAEALLRWHHPVHGLLLPHEILPAAEAHGCLARLESWVIERACRVAAALGRESGWRRVAINISVARLSDPSFPRELARQLDRHGASAERLELELHESDLMLAGERLLETIDQVRKLGVRIALDDVGSRQSSLRNLRRLPCDSIKISPSFAAALTECGERAQLASMILGVAGSLGLDVIATRVENAEQVDQLQARECYLMQGHHFGAPAPLRELQAGTAAFVDTPRRQAL